MKAVVTFIPVIVRFPPDGVFAPSHCVFVGLLVPVQLSGELVVVQVKVLFPLSVKLFGEATNETVGAGAAVVNESSAE